MIIVDTSVVYKWLVEEEPIEITTHAQEFLFHLLKNKQEIFAPDLLLYELANILSWKTNLKEIDIETAWKQFTKIPIKIITPTPQFIRECITFSKQHAVSVYDASYAVLAQHNKCNLVTADKKFQKLVKLPYVILL